MTFIGRKSTDRQLINHFYVIGHEISSEFGEIMQNNGHYAVQGHSVIQCHRFWYQSNAHIYDFLSVINTNLPPILHRFQVMADYMSNFR